MLGKTVREWRSVVVLRAQRACVLVDQAIKGRMFHRWSSYTQPTLLVANFRTAEAHYVRRLQRTGVQVLSAVWLMSTAQRELECKAVHHCKVTVTSRVLSAWYSTVCLHKKRRAALVSVSMNAQRRTTSIALFLWCTAIGQMQREERKEQMQWQRAIEKKRRTHLSFALKTWRTHAIEHIVNRQQGIIASSHYAAMLVRKSLSVWHNRAAIIVSRRARAAVVLASMNRKDYMRKTLNGWRFYVILMMPCVRRIYRARIKARVLRIGRKWKAWANKRALWRLVHSPLSTDVVEVTDKEDTRMKRRRPRCDMDLLASTDLTGVLSELRCKEDSRSEQTIEETKETNDRKSSSSAPWMRDLTDLQKELSRLTKTQHMVTSSTMAMTATRKKSPRRRSRRRERRKVLLVKEIPRRYGDRCTRRVRRSASSRPVVVATPSTYARVEDRGSEEDVLSFDDEEEYDDDWDVITEEDEDGEDGEDDEDEVEEGEEEDRASVLAVLQKIRSMRAAVEGTLTSP